MPRTSNIVLQYLYFISHLYDCIARNDKFDVINENFRSALEYVFPSEQKPIGILKRTEMITETGG